MEIGIEIVIILKVLFAGFMGALVGLERQIKGKPAGLKTNMLIAMGAALYTSIAIYLGATSDGSATGRIIGQIVTGVGFIGAGTIMRMNGSEDGDFTIGGLTSAAVTWLVAAIGVACGVELFLLAFVISFTVFVLLFFLSGADIRSSKIKKKITSKNK